LGLVQRGCPYFEGIHVNFAKVLSRMIRFVIALFVFAVVLCAYIVNLPGDTGRRTALPTPQADVSRNGATDTLSVPTPQAVADVPLVTVSDLPFATTADPLGGTVANVLVGLGLSADSLGPIGENARGPQSQLELIILHALQARTADAEIDAIVNDAALNHGLLVPDVLVGADGRVDTQTLLDATIATAMHVAGEPAPLVPLLSAHPSLTWIGDQAFHTVETTDSLASIAATYYGDATQTDALLPPNASVLSRADQITVGQRLLVPPL
jgi:hypothetical protein